MRISHVLLASALFVSPVAIAGLPSDICNHDVVIQNDDTRQMIVYDCANACNVVWHADGTWNVTDSNGGNVVRQTYDIPASDQNSAIC